MDMKKVRKNIDWRQIQKDNDDGLAKFQILEKYNISRGTLSRAEKRNIVKLVNHLPEELRQRRIKSLKKYLRENKDKHVWKRNSKFKSVPCECFKNKLKENNINFIEEYSPLDDRAFSIDVAFPDKKIGIEINGNQHYNSDGTLKKYYQERYDLITNSGWKLYEYHYSMVYNDKIVAQIMCELKDKFELGNIDYTFYIKEQSIEVENKRKMARMDFCKCGNPKHKIAKQCLECALISRRVCKRPSLKILLRDADALGYSGTGRKYGVSDNTIRKWIKAYEKKTKVLSS
ncbi:MAG: hypothetical protein Q8O88_04200 [bacterium]|nr:hypothetical protein [bacterium]